MSDVTAVVLTIGETYTERALASVLAQTQPVADTIVIEGVSPFYRALNTAAARVKTEFFIQVDADLILDPTCVADLRSLVSDETGVVVGQVRDPLRGRVPAIKLYRTRCFESGGLSDSISPDTDFAAELERRRWRRVYVLATRRENRAEWNTFAAHEPEYTPLYTFCKFVTEGARSRYRRSERRFLNLFRQQRESTHPAVPIAIVGIAHGLFLQEENDRLIPSVRTPEFDFLECFLEKSGEAAHETPMHLEPGGSSMIETFLRAHDLGAEMRALGATAAFLSMLDHLRKREDLPASVAVIGLCRGLLRGEADGRCAVATLRELVPEAADQFTPSSERTGT